MSNVECIRGPTDLDIRSMKFDMLTLKNRLITPACHTIDRRIPSFAVGCSWMTRRLWLLGILGAGTMLWDCLLVLRALGIRLHSQKSLEIDVFGSLRSSLVTVLRQVLASVVRLPEFVEPSACTSAISNTLWISRFDVECRNSLVHIYAWKLSNICKFERKHQLPFVVDIPQCHYWSNTDRRGGDLRRPILVISLTFPKTRLTEQDKINFSGTPKYLNLRYRAW